MIGEVLVGDSLEVLKEYPDDYFSAVLTDPPYGLGQEPDAVEVLKDWIEKGYHQVKNKSGFMGMLWDNFIPQPLLWKEVFRVLKPGGHMLVACGSRTQDWMCMALRLAGFEIRDIVTHHFGQGMAKAQNISLAIDEKLGFEREVIGVKPGHEEFANRETKGDTVFKNATEGFDRPWMHDEEKMQAYHIETAPASEEAKKFAGYFSNIKPATEFYTLVRKPISENTIADNVLKHSTGGLNIDGSRIGTEERAYDLKGGENLNKISRPDGNDADDAKGVGAYGVGAKQKSIGTKKVTGRFPANVVFSHSEYCIMIGTKKVKSSTGGYERKAQSAFVTKEHQQDNHGYGDDNGEGVVEEWQCADGCPVKELDEQSGTTTSGSVSPNGFKGPNTSKIYGKFESNMINPQTVYADTGGASRFFYIAKPSQSERNAGLENFKNKFFAGGHQAQAELKRGNTDFHSDTEKHSGYSSVREMKNTHPTLKSITLFRYLAKLIMPPDGILLDPFAGSGSTGCACEMEKIKYVLIEKEPEYAEIAVARCEHWHKEKGREQINIFEGLI